MRRTSTSGCSDIGTTGRPSIAIEGRPVVPMSEQPEVDVRLISPGYMSALHVPILRGRDISDADIAGRPDVVLISESMARQFWPGEDPLGKHLTLTFYPDAVREVVGFVGDVKLDSLDQTRPNAALYFPLDQISASSNGGWTSFPMTLVVRSTSASAGIVPARRRRARWSLMPTRPTICVRTRASPSRTSRITPRLWSITVRRATYPCPI